MTQAFTLGDEAHYWLGGKTGLHSPVLVTVTKITTTQITTTSEDGTVYRFRLRDQRKVSSIRGEPELVPVDHVAAARQQAFHDLQTTRRSIFPGSVGHMLNPDCWSNDPVVMQFIADELKAFLRRLHDAGVVLPTIQQAWLLQATQEKPQ